MSADNIKIEGLLTLIAGELYIARKDREEQVGERLQVWENEKKHLLEKLSDLRRSVM